MDTDLSKTVFIGVILLLIIFSQTSFCFGHSGDILSSWAIITPVIDGTISPIEWIDADIADFTLSYCSESHDVTLYVKNDDTYLYLAVIVRDEEYSNLAEMYHDFANFYFDNDNDGATAIGEDGLAIRFDNTIFRDTYNPTGVNGWSYSDMDYGGTNDIVGAVTHTNPVPDGVGDYTFEYRHPLDSIDNSHDFSLSAGDTVGFRFSFPDGETHPCNPVSYHWPSSSPASYGDIIIASEPYLKLLFVPMNWTNTQAAFDAQVDTQIDFFINAIPLSACPEKISITKLDVVTQNFSTFTCVYPTNCGVSSIGPFVTGLGINTADFDIIVGLIEDSPCPPIAGCSNGTDTIWVETDYESVTAHEIGHIYDLEDEYCSNPAGSTDCRCNDGDAGGCGDAGGDGSATGDINYLCPECVTEPCDCPPDGSDDCTGNPCCNFTYMATDYDCGVVNYGVCCLGNKNSAGGRAIMSFANVEVISPGPRDYDVHSQAHFASLPELNCSSPDFPLSARLIDFNIFIFPDDTVEEDKMIMRFGRPTRYYKKGIMYRLSALDYYGKILWSRAFDIHFDYNGPVYLNVNYSKIRYRNFPFSYKIPLIQGMNKLVLQHKDKVIFSKLINFCNNNGVCDNTETYQTCPKDCPLYEKDKICIDRNEGVCDPDCLPGVDPDCQGECGNGVCNINENYENCPKDCPTGGKDGYCDGKEDERCDPDCKEDEDPDCKSKCGDGVCSSCSNPMDIHACENYGNCPNDCPSGGEDQYCDKLKDGICDPDCCKNEDPDCKVVSNWMAMRPYNVLWPLWSRALSPPDPLTGLPTPLVKSVTKDTILPKQPCLVGNPNVFYPIWPYLIYTKPSGFKGGLLYYDQRYGLNLWPPPNMLDPSTGYPIPITLKPSYSSLPPTSPLKFIDTANKLFSSKYGVPISELLTVEDIWGADICQGDFDDDGDVDGSDLAIFAADFGRTNCQSPPPCEGDFDGDGDVDGSDLAAFAADFGRTDCP